jgi:hypothetical protein
MVQSVTTGSITGSVAGNYQSYSVSGSMKREHSNESGSLMRSQDLKKAYGGEYSDSLARLRQEEVSDPRRAFDK